MAKRRKQPTRRTSTPTQDVTTEVTNATAAAVENERFRETVVKRIPARRWGGPEDLEGIAVYLASDASRYHTGDSLRVDGGYTIF